MKNNRTTALLIAGLVTGYGVTSASAVEQIQAATDTALTTSRLPGFDPGSHEFRQRAGIPVHETTTSVMPSAGPKGGMAKEPIVTSQAALWEVYGSLYYYTEEYDEEFALFGPGTAPILVTTRADTEIDVFGGLIGVERCLAPEWRIGLALGLSEADTDLSVGGLPFGTIDTDTFSVMPYLKFDREDAFGSADWWANFLYGYNDQSFDFNILGLPASADGDSHVFKVNTGINFDSANWVHGPYAGFRYIDGDMDAIPVFGVGSTDYESFVSVLGYHVTNIIDLNGGKLVPQFRVAWEHEFEDGNTALFGLPLAGNVEDIMVIGAGCGFYCDNGWNAVLDYEARLASEVEGHYIGFKVGKEF